MRTPRVEGPQEPASDKHARRDGARPKRGSEKGPLGFGSVMRDVRGGRHGTGGDGGNGETGAAGSSPVLTPGMAGFDPAAARAAVLDPGARAAREMGAVASPQQLLDQATFGVQDPTEALAAQDRSPTQQANLQLALPTAVARMTPAALLETVLDESTKLEIERASKELHVELEPEDLGPVVVRLRRGPDGALDIKFRTREGDAARVLESGSELLRSRLVDAGYANVAIDVSHDAELRLGGAPVPWRD